ncbi:hypothetical protein ACT7V1_004159 [Salmonella enterica subsp. enterica]|nr:hypothetical protein [Salmonella enterica subsp. enterica serovar Durham]EHW9667334.1 hypothetical protein [Salmonella enterica subsp. enterica serovar Agbeni]EIU1267264.1 hypothetical protein [Salmonella enterica subsp. enterica serovar Agbeni]EJI2509776.1 hypothetical protein [Salmonella enterica]EJI5362934.1 hypothetical protein [Salmonella enterica]
MKLDNLDNCPQCGEDMREGERLCRTCLQQEKIDNMTDADYRAGNVGNSLPSNNWPPITPINPDYATYSLVDILWKQNDPSAYVKFKGPGPGEYQDTPFKGSQFDGWEKTLVAKYVFDWFIKNTRKQDD